MWTIDETQNALRNLFVKAKEVDEFEYCCTLLRIRGIEPFGWDSLYESEELLQDVLTAIKDTENGKTKKRFIMFAYCHITEMDDLYSVIANLLRIIGGERYSLLPFMLYKLEGRKVKYPEQKIQIIKQLANQIGYSIIGEILDEVVLGSVRNSFYHSDYTLYSDAYNIVSGHNQLISNTSYKNIPWEILMLRVELAINLGFALFTLLEENISSYKKEEVVRGRFAANGGYIDIHLLVDDDGLIGFST